MFLPPVECSFYLWSVPSTCGMFLLPMECSFYKWNVPSTSGMSFYAFFNMTRRTIHSYIARYIHSDMYLNIVIAFSTIYPLMRDWPYPLSRSYPLRRQWPYPLIRHCLRREWPYPLSRYLLRREWSYSLRRHILGGENDHTPWGDHILFVKHSNQIWLVNFQFALDVQRKRGDFCYKTLYLV